MIGILTGLLMWDLKQRRDDRAALKAAEAKAVDMLRNLAEINNANAVQMKALAERVQHVDLMLSQGAAASNPFARAHR